MSLQRAQAGDSIKLNNKDLIIVSLLEQLCEIKERTTLFTTICAFLKKNRIIDSDSVYSPQTENIRQVIQETIMNFLDNNQVAKNYDLAIKESFKNIYDSRYNKDFIEIEKLGKGGFGRVYKVCNRIDENLYAIKRIQMRELEEERSNFYLNEVRLLSKLFHPNIVRYFCSWMEFHIEDGLIIPTLFLQMELCKNSLGNYMLERNYGGEEIDTRAELTKFRQIVNAINYIHGEGIIHGDLTPYNIFLDDEDRIKVGDFGLAKQGGEDESESDPYYGNELYMAPEVINDSVISKKSDIFSMGIILFELTTRFRTAMERHSLIIQLKTGGCSSVAAQFQKEIEQFIFDRVICDVQMN